MGQWIPGETSVSMTAYAAHHDPSIFPAPTEFQPQRWMDPQERRRMDSSFIPFSKGGRGCLGRNISYLEQTIVVASLVHRYDFELVDEKLEKFEAFNLLMGPMPIKMRRRRQSVVCNILVMRIVDIAQVSRTELVSDAPTCLHERHVCRVC